MKNVAGIFLYKDKKLLLQKRSEKAKNFPGMWSFFGGKIEIETPEEAIRREVREELGFDLDDFEFFRKYTREKNPDITQRDEMHIFIGPIKKNLCEMKLMEGDDFGYFSFEEIEKLNLVPTDRPIIEEIEKLPIFR